MLLEFRARMDIITVFVGRALQARYAGRRFREAAEAE
jgi:hypothetical protein